MTLHELQYKDYEAYKKSPYWKRIAEMVGVGKKKCYRCGKRLVRIPHHLRYDTLGEEKRGDVVGVCFPCNSLCHFFDTGRRVPLTRTALTIRWNEINSRWWYLKQKRSSDLLNWIFNYHQ